MQKNKLNSIVNNIKDIPTLPSVVLQVNRVLGNDRGSIDGVGEIIEKDSALTSKILKLANSSYYGLSSKVDTLSRAIMILGFNIVRNVAVTVSLSDMFSKSGSSPVDIKGLWFHNLGCAIASKALASNNRDSFIQEKAYIGGILHDIGKLIIYTNLAEDTVRIMERIKISKSLPMIEAEKSILGFTHCEMGALIARKWHFPPEFTAAIKQHHTPETAKEHQEVVYAVHAGNEISKALCLGASTSGMIKSIYHPVWEKLNITEEDLRKLLVEIEADFHEIVDSINLD